MGSSSMSSRDCEREVLRKQLASPYAASAELAGSWAAANPMRKNTLADQKAQPAAARRATVRERLPLARDLMAPPCAIYGRPHPEGGGDTLGLHRRLLGPGWGTPRASLTARVGHTPGFTHAYTLINNILLIMTDLS